MTAPAAIESVALTKRYGRGRGVEDLTLRVRAGEVFGYLGPNGAGKTTTIRMLLGLLRPTSGTAHVHGHDVWRDGVAARAWGVPLGALAAMVIAIFPSISASPELSKLIESYPESLKQTFGITDAFFSTPEGYLAGELFNLIAPLACSFFVLHAIAAALAGAEQRGTLDVVLSAPIRRRHYAAGWLLGLAIVLLAILAVLALVMQVSALVFGVDLVSDTVGRIDGISAFHYSGSAIEDGLDPGAFLGLTAAGLGLAAARSLLFERRDLRR